MKKSLLLTCLGMLLFGCGGSGGRGVKNVATDSGRVAVTVPWPTLSREIPIATTRVRAEVIRNGKLVLGNSVVREVGATQARIILETVPSGAAKIRVKAFDEANHVLASAETDLYVKPTGTSTTSITLSSVPGTVTDPMYVIGGSVSLDPADASLIQIVLPALVSRANGKPATGLVASNFKVFEDDVAKSPITVVPTGVSASKADVAIVVDTTGSMDEEIDGVRNSIRSFATSLAASGIDVRFAGASFGDEVRGVKPFTSDMGDFEGWVDGLEAQGGGDTPENPLDAIAQVIESGAWRADAQHIILVITDAPAHQQGDGSGITSRTLASIENMAKGNYVIHVVSPGISRAVRKDNFGNTVPPRRDPEIDVQPLATNTGGSWAALPYDGDVNLSGLPVASLIKAGYTVKFPSKRFNVDHQIRLIVTDGTANLAEQTFMGHY